MNELKANYHTHTTFCDGSDAAEAVVQEALRKGFTHLGFSGHMDPGVSMDYDAYAQEICRLQAAYRDQIDILRGAELDNVYDPSCVAGAEVHGSAEAVPSALRINSVLPDAPGTSAAGEVFGAPGAHSGDGFAVAGAEYTIGSTHFVPVPGSDVWSAPAAFGTHREGSENWDLIGVDGDIGMLHDQCRQYYGGDFYALSADYYRFEAMVAARLHPTFIGHFDLITRFNDLSRADGGHFLDETSERYLLPARRAMEALVPCGLPFEINCGAVNRGRKKELYPRPELLRHLHALGGKIVISADAHQKELLDGGFEEAMELARWAGFTHTNLLVREPGVAYRDAAEPAHAAAEFQGGQGYQSAVLMERASPLRPAKNTQADGGGTLYWQTMEI